MFLNNYHKAHNISYLGYCKKAFLIHDSYKFRARFHGFEVNDQEHVTQEHYLLRISRDSCQNNCYEAQKLFHISITAKAVPIHDSSSFWASLTVLTLMRVDA